MQLREVGMRKILQRSLKKQDAAQTGFFWRKIVTIGGLS
jgi:hypothetical protein